jgi:SAM-dependent methyltransferase
MVLSGREFEPVGDHAGSAYLRYSFTKGTEQEVAFLVDELGLSPGSRVLDVGCGPGRHAAALRARGIETVGIDISVGLLRAAGPGNWVRADARDEPFGRGSFDAAFSVCQGGFGLLGGAGDLRVLGEMAAVVRNGGRVAVSAPSSYFVVRHLEEGDTFDASEGVNHERVAVRDPSGTGAEFDLWSTCFTPRELRLMCAAVGLRVRGVWSVRPGAYRRHPPVVDRPELLLVAEV